MFIAGRGGGRIAVTLLQRRLLKVVFNFLCLSVSSLGGELASDQVLFLGKVHFLKIYRMLGFLSCIEEHLFSLPLSTLEGGYPLFPVVN